MRITACFLNERTRQLIERVLPITQTQLWETLDELDLRYDRDKCKRTLQVPDLHIDYTGTDVQEDFIMINLMASAMAEVDEDVLDVYLQDKGNLDSAEIVNICLQEDEIEYYSYAFDEGTRFGSFGRTLLDGECPEIFENYVDWHDLGVDYSGDYYLGEHGYIDYYGMDTIDMSYYDFEEMCERLDWDLEEEDLEEGATPPHKQYGRAALRGFLKGVDYDVDTKTA